MRTEGKTGSVPGRLSPPCNSWSAATAMEFRGMAGESPFLVQIRLRDMEPRAGCKPEQRIGQHHRHQNARIEQAVRNRLRNSKRFNGRPANNGALDFLTFLLFSETQFIELL